MYFVYMDDSGDTGLANAKGSTKGYVLSAVLVRDVDWLSTLNQLADFRRFLYKNFGIRHGDELKAAYLIHGNGPLKHLKLSQDARMKIYKMALKLQAKMGTTITWATVIDKDKWVKRGYHMSILEASWVMMIERLERFTAEKKEPCMVFPDDGNDKFVRGMFRRMRRFSRPNAKFPTSEPLKRNAELVLEDPNFRHSHDSYFVQLADLNAYAAHRHVYPTGWFGKEYWDLLGVTRYEKVHKLNGGPSCGIVLRP